MALRCRLCDETFADHLVVHARASVHWRGKSFDAREAQGQIGLEVMAALGEDPGDPAALDAFLERTHVEAFREDPMGVEPWQGEKDPDEGEDWEFHLGFREPLDEADLEAAGEAAEEAVGSHENFGRTRLVREGEAVEPVEPDEEEDDGAEGGGEETVDSWTHPDLDDGEDA